MIESREGLFEIKARLDIHDVLARYCRGADRCDPALMQSCFHEDAWDDHGFFNGPAKEFAARAANSLRERFISSKHYMTNEYVEIDGNKATSETYILALMRKREEGKLFDVMISARYLDRFECRNGEWRIVHRLLVNDGVRVDPAQGDDARMNQGRSGERGEADPSCSLFKSLPQ
jgi:SnoaL-like protein